MPGLTGRAPAARQRLVCHAAVYGRRFLPQAPWTLADTDEEFGLLVWERPDGVRMADVPRSVRADVSLRPAWLDAGMLSRLRAGGVGPVRLLALGAPNLSLAVDDHGRLAPLADGAAPDLPAW